MIDSSFPGYPTQGGVFPGYSSNKDIKKDISDLQDSTKVLQPESWSEFNSYTTPGIYKVKLSANLIGDTNRDDTLSDADFTTLTGIIHTMEDVNDPFYDTNTDNLIDVVDVTMLTEIHNGYQDPEWYCLLIVSKSVSNKRVQTIISPIGNTVYRRQNNDGWSEWKVPEMPLNR